MINIDNALIKYRDTYLDEKDKVDAISEFINNNYKWWSRDNLEGHVTGSAFLLSSDYKSVLLTHHKKYNRWIQLGGHCEKPDIFETAYRECIEESGYQDINIFSYDILDIDILKVSEFNNIPSHYHYDVVYLFLTNKDNQFFISDESNDLKWVDLNELEKYTSDLRLFRLRDKTINLINYA